MSLEKTISTSIMEAMKAKDQVRLTTLRNIKKYIIDAKSVSAAIEELTDEEVIKIITKLAKQGSDSAELFTTQGREDLATDELAQVAVLKEFLPAQLSDEELTEKVAAIIAQCGATSPKEMGKVMGIASKELAGKSDGKAISAKVRELLSQN